MQLMIDSADGAEKLRLAALFLQQLADVDAAPIMGEESKAFIVGRRVLQTSAPVFVAPSGSPPSPEEVDEENWTVGIPDDGAPPTMPPAAVVFAKPMGAPPAPPPPPAPPVQQSLGAAMAAPAVTAEYDSTGMPWDARIHQTGRGKKKNGEWKIKKGLQDEYVQGVVRELAVQTPTATVPLPPVAPPAPPAVAARVDVQPAPAAPSNKPFMELMQRIMLLQKNAAFGGRTAEGVDQTQARINEIVRQAGAPSLQALANTMRNLIPDVMTLLDAAEAGIS